MYKKFVKNIIVSKTGLGNNYERCNKNRSIKIKSYINVQEGINSEYLGHLVLLNSLIYNNKRVNKNHDFYLRALDYLLYFKVNNKNISEISCLKDRYIKNLSPFFWVACEEDKSALLANRLLFDKFISKMGIHLYSPTYMNVHKMKFWDILVTSSSLSDVEGFLSKLFSDKFEFDLLNIPSGEEAIMRLEKLSSELNYERAWGSTFKFLKPNINLLSQYKDNKNLEEDYFLPYKYIIKTNFESIKYSFLPFFRQYYTNNWVEDNYGYSKNIAQDSPVKREKIIFLFNIGQTTLRFFNKPKNYFKPSNFTSLISYNLPFMSFLAKEQKNNFLDKVFLGNLHRFIAKASLVKNIIYSSVLKPIHNLSKLLLGFSIVLAIYPYKILMEAENSSSYVGYSLIFLICVQIILSFFKSVWYFFSGRNIHAKGIDIEVDVIVFFIIFLTLPLTIFGELIYNPKSPFLTLQKWYIK